MKNDKVPVNDSKRVPSSVQRDVIDMSRSCNVDEIDFDSILKRMAVQDDFLEKVTRIDQKNLTKPFII